VNNVSWEIVLNIYYSDAKEGRPCFAVAKGFILSSAGLNARN